MSRHRFLLRRIAGAVGTAWVLFTATFALVAFTPNQNRSPGVAGPDHRALAYRDEPLVSHYVDWLTRFLTFDLGPAYGYGGDPALSVIVDHAAFTLVYLVPAVVIAIALGIGVRLYAVASEGSLLDGLTDGLTYLAISVPVFLLAYGFKWWVLPAFYIRTGVELTYVESLGPLASKNLGAAVFPFATMTAYLLAIQSRYAGTELEEYAAGRFVKTARAKGASVPRVGRHVFRHAAIPLLTVLFADMLGMVLVGVFVVEYIVGVPGFGRLTFEAVAARDLPIMLGVVVLPMLVGVVTNFLQDVAYAVSDPRVEYGE